MTPEHYGGFDYIHQLNPAEMKRASAFGIPSRRMVLLPYGVSVPKFHVGEKQAARRHLGLPEDVPLVLTVGAHGVHKRLDFLVRHMVSVGRDTYLLIVGDASDKQTSELRALGRRLLRDRFKFVSLPHERMSEAYASADLYVHASLHEGFGLALVEAMAAGLPLVHHDEPGLNYAVGEGGLAINMADGQLLHDTLNSVLSDSEMAKQLGRQAKNRVTRKFTWQVLLPQYMKMYQEVLNVPIDN